MKIISMMISLIIVLSNMTIAFAEDMVKTYRFEDDITMNGVISSTEKLFKVSDNWSVNDAKLNLNFSKSKILDADYSTITVLINGTPIHSQKLDGKEEYKEELVVSIPKDKIKNGYNSLAIKAYKTISDVVCRDDSNTANWLVVNKGSSINIKYAYNKPQNLISEYPNIFTEVDEADNLNTTIVVPTTYLNSEISSAINLSADIGKKLKHENFKLNIKYESEINNENKNIIYIGSLENTSDKILNTFTKEELGNLNNKCIIKVDSSPFNKDKKIMIIVSSDESLLSKATQLVSSNSLIKNLNKNVVYIDKYTDVLDIEEKNKNNNKIYLKDLGYSDFLVKGPFSQEVTFDTLIPKRKLASVGSKIKLNFRYADNLDFDRSLVTVYVNETPIGSKKLTSENSDDDSMEINFPNDVLNKSYYKVKITFNLELKDLQCVTRETETPWAYVSNNSYLDLNYSDNNLLSFNNYPYQFIENGKINDLDIVIPKNMTSKDLTGVGRIASFVGRDLKYNVNTINVLNDEDFLKSNKKSNSIIIGTPSNNKVIKDINKKLNITYNENFTGFINNEKIKFIESYNSEISTMQLIESLYSSGKISLVVASNNVDDFSIASNYLSNLNTDKNVNGDTIIIDRDGQVEVLNYKNAISENIETSEQEKENTNVSKESTSFILITGVIFVTLIVAIILLTLKYKKR